ncbi:hypothetical protein, partial [Escherichia coli]|uniref:hypothetical protein n=1 Tax=Escherichia coli TaxID=562 RepID=UPI001BCCAB43
MTIKHHCLRNGVFVFICFILGADALAVKQIKQKFPSERHLRMFVRHGTKNKKTAFALYPL